MNISSSQHIALLPSTVICAMSWAPLIRVYREYVAEMLHSSTDGPTRNHAPNQSGAFCSEIIATFPKIVADPAMITALTAHWYQQKQAMKNAGTKLTGSQWKDPKFVRQAFTYVIHRLWLASCAKAAQRPLGRISETYDQVQERSEAIKSIFYSTTDDILSPLTTDTQQDEGHLFAPFNTREVAFQFRT